MGTRRQVIAGNWKMNTTREEAIALAKAVAKAAASHPHVDTIVHIQVERIQVNEWEERTED